MKKLIVFFFLSSLILCLNCTKKKEEDKTAYLSQEFLSYIDFPIGSYWIYKDTAVGTIDSIYVIENQRIKKHDRNEKLDYETISVHTVHHSKGFKDTIFGRGLSEPGFREGNNPLCGYHVSLPKYGIMDIFKFFTPNEVGKFAPLGGSAFINAKNDKLIIQGREYSNTVTTEFKVQQNGNLIKSEVYAQNVGVIRTVYSDGHVFDLIRYHINK